MLSIIALRTEDARLGMACMHSVRVWFSAPRSVPTSGACALLSTDGNGTDGVVIYRAMFVDLDFGSAPEDLMAKSISSLVLLPNLKTLEVFCTDRNELFLGGLK